MRYGLGECLADFGFTFLEKVHEPIFLVNKLGKLVKVNEAGRKFLLVSRHTASELENFVSTVLVNAVRFKKGRFHRMPIGKKGMQLIARTFVGSEMILIEVKK